MIDVALLVAAYVLTQQDKKKLADAIKMAYLLMFYAAYVRAAKNAGVSPSWRASAEEELLAEAMAEQDAADIAATYSTDIQRAIDVFLAAWLAAHGSYDGANPHLAAMLTAWCKARAGWKSKQITRMTIGRGLSAGTAAFVQDFLAGDIADTSGMGTDGLYIGVVPESSSSDFCEDYAGFMWPIAEYPGLGMFPAHVGCIHSEIVLRY